MIKSQKVRVSFELGRRSFYLRVRVGMLTLIP